MAANARQRQCRMAVPPWAKLAAYFVRRLIVVTCGRARPLKAWGGHCGRATLAFCACSPPPAVSSVMVEAPPDTRVLHINENGERKHGGTPPRGGPTPLKPSTDARPESSLESTWSALNGPRAVTSILHPAPCLFVWGITTKTYRDRMVDGIAARGDMPWGRAGSAALCLRRSPSYRPYCAGRRMGGPPRPARTRCGYGMEQYIL